MQIAAAENGQVTARPCSPGAAGHRKHQMLRVDAGLGRAKVGGRMAAWVDQEEY